MSAMSATTRCWLHKARAYLLGRWFIIRGVCRTCRLGCGTSVSKKNDCDYGDGSLQINIQDLDTLNRLTLDLIVIVMNNTSLGMVKNLQDMYFIWS